MNARIGKVWLGFWLVIALVSLGFSFALSRTPGQVILVGTVGLVLAVLVFVSGLSELLRWLTQSEGGPRSIDTPLVLLLVAAFISFCFAVLLWFFVNKEYGTFAGLWVPSILSLAATIQATRRATSGP